MGLGDFFGKLFGGNSSDGAANAEAGDAVEHEGYSIVPAPFKDGGQYRTAGIIRREIDGTVREARFIRADNSADRQAALDHSVQKARQIIAEQGERMFERENV